MHLTTMSGAANCRAKGSFCDLATLLLACLALALTVSAPAALAQAVNPPSTPSAGKALVCIYRVSRFVGSASHDTLYVNEVLLGTLLNGEYECTEVAPGTVVVSGLPKMYYGGVTQSIGAALVEARKKENERIRFDAEADKTYYLKWTSETMGTGIKVTPQDASVGAKEMSKLHPSKPPEDKDSEKDAGK
jgi:hypothetical protein